MNDKEKCLMDTLTQPVVSNRLAVLPITEFGFEWSKQQLCDSVRLRYGWEISNLPTTFPCEIKFDIQHSMTCKKGSFISTLQNDL